MIGNSQFHPKEGFLLRLITILTVLACLVQTWQVPCDHCLDEVLHGHAASLSMPEAVELDGSHNEPSDSDHHDEGCCSGASSFAVNGKSSIKLATHFVYAASQSAETTLTSVHLGNSAAQRFTGLPPLRLHLIKCVLLV
jgi:hypothetical protein